MNTKCIIFDLDGTILDTSKGIIKSIYNILDIYNMSYPDKNEIYKFIGPPIQKSFKTYYNISIETADIMAKEFRKIYKTKYLFDATPYNGIYNLIDILRSSKIITAIATYKSNDYTTNLLDHFGLSNRFDCIKGSDVNGSLTKTDIISECINYLKIDNIDNIVYIGDTINDFYSATKIGIKFIGVNYGFGFKNIEEIVKIGSSNFAETCFELISILKKFCYITEEYTNV